MKPVARVMCFVACLLLVGALALAPVRAVAEETEVSSTTVTNDACEYLIFALHNFPHDQAREKLKEIHDFYGPNTPGAKRQWGFSLWTLMLLKQTPEKMQAIMDQAFELAEEFNAPVYLHLDMLHNPPSQGDSYKTLTWYRDPMICEWVAFPKPGHAHGPVPRYWCNWGAWFSAPAFPCFTAPKFQKLIVEQLEEGVLEPLHKHRARLGALGKAHLFAGICIGWETNIPNLTPGDPHVAVDPDVPPVDRFSIPPVVMQRWEMGQFGYAALHHMGYDAERVAAEAAERGVTSKEHFIHLTHKATHAYNSLLAKAAFDSGLPRHKIYSHGLAMTTRHPIHSSHVPPIWASVTPHCTPGFTMDNFGAAVYDIEQMIKEIRTADPTQKHFACAETYFRRGMTTAQFTQFLDECFNHGCRLVHILAWHEGQSPDSPYYVPKKMVGPHVSVAEWLKGDARSAGN